MFLFGSLVRISSVFKRRNKTFDLDETRLSSIFVSRPTVDIRADFINVQKKVL